MFTKTKALKLFSEYANDDTHAVWDVVGATYQDNGDVADGNTWLETMPIQDYETGVDIVEAVVKQGFGEVIDVLELNGTELMEWLGITNDEVASEELQEQVEARSAGWAHYGAYGAGDERWLIIEQYAPALAVDRDGDND